LDHIKEKVDGQAMVLHEYKNGHTMYKVLIGRYATEHDAREAQIKLKHEKGLESIIY
jgi:septal ring-binding cell division protein DamX